MSLNPVFSKSCKELDYILKYQTKNKQFTEYWFTIIENVFILQWRALEERDKMAMFI